jgi:hypothetical protein
MYTTKGVTSSKSDGCWQDGDDGNFGWLKAASGNPRELKRCQKSQPSSKYNNLLQISHPFRSDINTNTHYQYASGTAGAEKGSKHQVRTRR